jgi:hypothetical protein
MQKRVERRITSLSNSRARTLSTLGFSAVSIALIYVAVKCFIVLVSPVLIVNKDPKAAILIDGVQVKFDNGAPTGTIDLFCWRSSYLIEVRSLRGDQRRRIYPSDTDYDSASIIVDKKDVHFNVKNVVVE